MTLDGIKTTEYIYQQNASAAQGGQSTTAPNSIHTVAAPQTSGSVEENKPQNTSKLDELLEKLCAELSKFGLKPEELKKSGIIFKITGMNATQVENLDDKELKNIIDCLKEAIKDSVVDGKVDLEKAGNVANDYYVATKTGWTIEGFKKHNNAVKKSTLFERLKETKCIAKDADINTIKPEELANAIDKFFNETLLSQLKTAKTQKAKEQIYKGQLQTFGRLLINTPDDQKAIFKQAISSLVASNRIKGLDATLDSFDTPQARTEWADSWSTEEIKNVTTKADVEGNIPEQKDATALVTKVTTNSSEEAIQKRHDEVQAEAIDFFKNNKEALEVIAKKEDNQEELTPEEKALKLQRDNYFTAFKAGEITGTALNEIIAQQAKTELLDKMNKDAYELPIYKEVLKQVTEFIENNPEALTMSKEELTKVLDEATNGNYSIVKPLNKEQLKNVELKAPAEKEEVETQNADYGFTQKENIDSTRLLALQQQVAQTADNTNNTFVVEGPQVKSEKLNSQEVYALKNQAFRNASNIASYLKEVGETKFSFAAEVFKKFNNMGSTTQDWAMNYFSNSSHAVQNLFLNKITGSVSGMITAAKEVDLSKFDLIGVSITTQKQIDKIQAEKV